MIDDEHHEALGAMIHAMKPRDYHREIADERDRLREALRKTAAILETLELLVERPLYRDLEVGFRHHPLSPKEIAERYAETCAFAHQDVKAARAILKETQRDS